MALLPRLCGALCVLAAAPLAAAAWPSSALADVLSSTHWAPCYYNSTAPSLLDGVATLRGLGTRAIKLALDDPRVNYPWNSPAWPASTLPSVAALASHPYYAAAFSDPAYSTYSLITYSQGVTMFCEGDSYDAAAAAADTAQFKELTELLLSTYPSKTWILESWEVRCARTRFSPRSPLARAPLRPHLRPASAPCTPFPRRTTGRSGVARTTRASRRRRR